jgi:hypothetical protein
MTFFADLTPYTYWDTSPHDPAVDEEPWPNLPLINLGWLDADYPFPIGVPPAGLLARLGELAKVRVRQTRGYHYCQFCIRSFGRSFGEDAREAVRRDLIPRESAEFRVKGSGVVYAVPQLALHYISAHRYRPPAEFCEAVMTSAARRATRNSPPT